MCSSRAYVWNSNVKRPCSLVIESCLALTFWIAFCSYSFVHCGILLFAVFVLNPAYALYAYEQRWGLHAYIASSLTLEWKVDTVGSSASHFWPNCYRRFVRICLTSSNCFGIRTWRNYWNIVKFVEVNGLGNFWKFCSRTMCRLHLQRQEILLSKLHYRPTCRCSTGVWLFMLLK